MYVGGWGQNRFQADCEKAIAGIYHIATCLEEKKDFFFGVSEWEQVFNSEIKIVIGEMSHIVKKSNVSHWNSLSSLNIIISNNRLAT